MGEPEFDGVPVGPTGAADGLRSGFGSGGAVVQPANSAPKSVVTSLMAGFAGTGSVLTSRAGFAAAESVITSMAGFAGRGRSPPPGGRKAIPAAFK